MWHWTKDELGVAVQSCLWMQVELMAWEFSRLERLNGIKWSWVQFPHRPTFYSYFQESVSDEYHMYIYINVSRIIEQLWIYYLKFHDFTWRSWKKHETLSSKFIAVLFILLRSYILSAVNELQLFIIWYIYIYIYIVPGALSTVVTSVVLYSLTRATLMSSGKDETRVCGYTLWIYSLSTLENTDENRIFFVRSPHHKHFGKAQHLVLWALW